MITVTCKGVRWVDGSGKDALYSVTFEADCPSNSEKEIFKLSMGEEATKISFNEKFVLKRLERKGDI